MKNILQYLTPEILAWESGNIREVRPLGSVLCLPDGREFPPGECLQQLIRSREAAKIAAAAPPP